MKNVYSQEMQQDTIKVKPRKRKEDEAEDKEKHLGKHNNKEMMMPSRSIMQVLTLITFACI